MNYIVSFPGLGIENLDISPIAFNIFGFPVYWYGLLIASAVLLGMTLALRQCKQFDLLQDDVLDALLLAVPLAIVCARLYYVIFEWDMFKGNLLRIFDTRSGGLAFYGGVIGGVLGVFIISRFKKIKFHRFVDFLIVYIPLGQAIGRWGNFFNQEAFGTNTSLPWGMISNRTRSYLAGLGQAELNPDLPVHPTFFYEFIANLLIFAILLRIRKQSKQKYETFAWYILLYGAVRFFVESIRTDSLYLGDTNIRVSMLLSALMVVAGLIFLGYHWANDRRVEKQLTEVVEEEEENNAFSDITEEISATVGSFEDDSEETTSFDVVADVNEGVEPSSSATLNNDENSTELVDAADSDSEGTKLL